MANIDFCTTVGGNTGLPDCDVKMGVPKGLVFVPKNAEITEADSNDLLSYVISKTKEDASQVRWYPFMNIRNITDQSEEPTEANLAGTGYSEKLRDGSSIYLFEFESMLCKNKAIVQFDGWTAGVYIITSDNKIWGRKQEDGSLKPFIVASTSVYGGGFNDGQNIITKKLKLNLGPQPVMQSAAGFFPFEADDDLQNITGLVTLKIVKTATDKQFALMTDCEGKNIYDAYKSQVTSTLWKVTDLSDGTDIPVTTVTPNDATKAFDLTFTPPASPGSYSVELTSVSDLETAGIVGYVGNKLVVKV